MQPLLSRGQPREIAVQPPIVGNRSRKSLGQPDCEVGRRCALIERAMISQINPIKWQPVCEVGRSGAHNERAATLHEQPNQRAHCYSQVIDQLRLCALCNLETTAWSSCCDFACVNQSRNLRTTARISRSDL